MIETRRKTRTKKKTTKERMQRAKERKPDRGQLYEWCTNICGKTKKNSFIVIGNLSKKGLSSIEGRARRHREEMIDKLWINKYYSLFLQFSQDHRYTHEHIFTHTNILTVTICWRFIWRDRHLPGKKWRNS